MPEYDVTIGGKTYVVKSDKPLSDVQAYQYAQMQAAATPAPTTRAEAKAQGKPRTALDRGKQVLRTVGDAVFETAKPILMNLGPGQLLPFEMRNSELASKAFDYGIDKLSKRKELSDVEQYTPNERLAYETGKGVLESVVGGGRKVGEVATNALAGGLASATSEKLRQENAPGWLQTIGGLAAGIGIPTAVSGAKNAIGNILDYTTGGGAERRAVKTLQERAVDPARVAETIENRPAPTPGVQPTVAEVAQSPGIAALQRSLPNERAKGRMARNQQARQQAVDTVGGGGNAQVVQDVAQTRKGELERELGWRQRRAETARERRAQEASQEIAATQEANRASLAAVEARGARELGGVEQRGIEALTQAKAAGEEALATRIQQGKDMVNRRVAALGDERTRTESGRETGKEILDEYQKVKDETDAAYDAWRADTSPITLSANKVKRIFDDINARAEQYYGDLGGQVPKAIKDKLTEVFTAFRRGDVNTRTVANIDRMLGNFASDKRLTRLSDDRIDAAYVESLRRTLDDHLDPLIPAASKELGEKAKAARRYQGEVYEQSDLGDLIAAKKYGKPGEMVTHEAALARKIVAGGDQGAIHGEELIKMVGQNKASRMVGQEMRRLGEEGKLNANALVRYGPIFEKFPKVRAQVEEIVSRAEQAKGAVKQTKAATAAEVGGVKAATAAEKAAQEQANALRKRTQTEANIEATRRQGLQTRWDTRRATRRAAQDVKDQDAINKAFLASPLGKTADPGVSPRQHISDLLAAKDDGRGFASLRSEVAGNIEAEAGLRRAMADHVDSAISKGGRYDENNQLIPDNRAGIKAIDDVLDRGGDLLTDQQRRTMTTIREELKAVDFAKTGGVVEPMGDKIGTIPAPTAVQRNVIRSFIEHFKNTDKMNEVIKGVLLDPELAADFLKRKTTNHVKRFMRTLGQTTAASLAATPTPYYPDTSGLTGTVTDTGEY